MQIVINISEESYKNIKEQVNKRDYPDMQIGKAIADGKPLPKGHGRLVDVDLLRDQVSHDKREAFSKHQVWLLLSIHNKNIPTILDADEAYKNRVIGVDLNHAESEDKETMERIEKELENNDNNMEECPICEYPISNCQCYYGGTAHPDRSTKREVVLEHLYMLSKLQIEHIKNLEEHWQICYADEERKEILNKMSKKHKDEHGGNVVDRIAQEKMARVDERFGAEENGY